MKPINIELFPCSGGMSEGFRRAGIEFDLAFDIDPDACTSHEKNVGLRPVQMDVRDLLRLLDAGVSLPPVDLLVADPPCTPWSRAGKRKGTADERDMLLETCAIIARLRPRLFLVGNVPGLDDSNNWPTVQKTLGAIPGYCVDYKTLDAADYGVPQRRVRPFWFGHREGPCIQWPKPTHGDPRELGYAELGEDRVPWRTCRDALAHLPLEELGKPARMRMRKCNGKQHGSVAEKPARGVGTSNLSDGNVLTAPTGEKSKKASNGHPPATPDAVAPTITTRDGNNTHSGALTLLVEPTDEPQYVLVGNTKHPPNVPDEPSYTVTTKGDGRGAQGAAVMHVEGKGGYHVPQSPDKPSATITAPVPGPRSRKALEWPWTRPATTVSRQDFLDEPGHHGQKRRNPYTNANCIVLSEKAATILQGFPEDWVFAGETKKGRWSQIGQAIPPPLAYAVASQIVKRDEASRKTEKELRENQHDAE